LVCLWDGGRGQTFGAVRSFRAGAGAETGTGGERVEQKYNSRRGNGSKQRGAKKPGGQVGADSEFDDWLEARLKGAYSSVLDEPVPEDLIQLLTENLKD
jgi:hypothetical protein